MNEQIYIKQRDKNLYSLRQRYLFISTIIVFFIFAFAWLAQSHLQESSARQRHNIELRQQAGLLIRQLREEIQHSEKSVEAYIRTPSSIYRDSTHHGIDKAIQDFKLLRQHEWFMTHQLDAELSDFDLDLRALHTTVDSVMDLRQDEAANLVDSGNFTLGANHANQHFLNANQQLQQLNPVYHGQLVAMQLIWQRLQQHLNDIDTPQTTPASGHPNPDEEIASLLAELEREITQLSATPSLSSQPSQLQLLKEMREAMDLWRLSYDEQREYGKHTRSGYRSYLEHTVQPHLEHIWSYIRTLEKQVDNFANDDTMVMSEVATTIANVIWLFSILALGVITLAYLYFQRTVLKPVATVAAALKMDASGRQVGSLPKVHNLETRDLIEAYEEMRQQVQDRQQALEHIAMHDSLTTLPNRYQLMGVLQQMCETFRKEGAVFAVLMLGLDRFKEVNDTLGQQTGDDILKKFGQRLRLLLRDHDNVARFASDEFAVVLHHTSKEEALYVARKIMREMEQPFDVDGINLSVSCSIGITLFPEHGQQKEELTRRANIAMARAKQHKIGIAVYKEQYDTSSVESISLAGKLRQAIQRGALHLCYQPQYLTHNRSLSGLEVLCRWDDPERGNISPGEFIPVAEQSGQIHALTEWVLETALKDAQQWQKRKLDCGILSVNISAFNLHAPNFIPMLQEKLQKWKVPAERLMLEVTETAMMVDPDHAIKTLGKLHELGLKLSIDDYGTGFSSLAYVKRLPVDELKIDKSFVLDMTHDENDAVIVRSTIELAHNLGLKVVAEGVDSQDKVDLLEILNCDYMQGFHLGKPLPAEQIERFLPPLDGRETKVHHLKDYR